MASACAESAEKGKQGLMEVVHQKFDRLYMRLQATCHLLAGFGAQKLSTLASYAIRKNLLAWLEQHKVHLLQFEQEKKNREARQVKSVIPENRQLVFNKLFCEREVTIFK